jgi:cellulose synthase/poly-beta-1,6-N-acetylglucosamine synthase-like glycosyltransferase
MKIMMGCPVQNRALIIAEHFMHIGTGEVELLDVDVVYLVNNSQDNTLKILEFLESETSDQFNSFKVINDEDFDYADRRTSERDYHRIAEIKNKWLSYRKKRNDYVWLVDSDVLTPKNALSRLLSHNKDIVAGKVLNNILAGGKEWYNAFRVEGNVMDTVEDGEELIEVDITGACCLYSKEVLDAGVKFGYNHNGEDVALCLQAQKKGFKIYWDPLVQCKHFKEDILNYSKNKIGVT